MKRILVIGFLLTWVAVAFGEQRVALVIGNGAYQDGPLRNPPNDARAMAQALRECGFDVIEKINSDQRTMEDAIRDFGQQIQKGGVGLFYYAGHGMQVQDINYLIPVGAEVKAEDEVKYEAVDAGRVLSKMESAGNRLNIIILDACRNNPFARSFRSADRGLKKMDAPTGSILAYATAPGEIAAEGEGANGLYTSVLLKYLGVPGLKLTDMFMKVRREVAEASSRKQIPWESSSLMEDFFFVILEEPGLSSLSSQKRRPTITPPISSHDRNSSIQRRKLVGQPSVAMGVIPGLYQYKNRSRLKGGELFLLNTLSLGWAIGFHRSSKDWRDRYDAYRGPDVDYLVDLRDGMQTREKWRNMLLGAAGGFYLLNWIDVIWGENAKTINANIRNLSIAFSELNREHWKFRIIHQF